MRLLIATLVLAHEILAQNLVPAAVEAETTCDCEGMLIEKRLGFEVDAHGNSLSAGDTPNELPYGITVTGQRFEKGIAGPPTDNDLVIFNTDVPTGMDLDLAVEGEMNVLIIHENGDKSNPDDARFGGEIKFDFVHPICRLTEVRFLDLETDEKVYVSGTDTLEASFEKVRVPAGGEAMATSLFPLNYVNVKSLDVTFGDGIHRATGAIAALVFSVCVESDECPPGTETTRGGACVECAPGYFSATGESCQKCPAGTYSDDRGLRECNSCEKGSISIPGSSTCTRCEGNTIPNESGNKCIPCKPGYATVNNEACKGCNSGTFSPDGSICMPCEGGTVAREKSDACTPCPSGEVADDNKQNCIPGDTEESVTAVPSPATLMTSPVTLMPSPATLMPSPVTPVPSPAPSMTAPSVPTLVTSMPSPATSIPNPAPSPMPSLVRSETPSPTQSCPPGYRKKQRKCRKCKAGSFSDDGTVCHPCTGNTFSKKKAAECTPCPLGTAANSKHKKCLPVATREPTSPSVGPSSARFDSSTMEPTRSTPSMFPTMIRASEPTCRPMSPSRAGSRDRAENRAESGSSSFPTDPHSLGKMGSSGKMGNSGKMGSGGKMGSRRLVRSLLYDSLATRKSETVNQSKSIVDIPESLECPDSMEGIPESRIPKRVRAPVGSTGRSVSDSSRSVGKMGGKMGSGKMGSTSSR